MKQFKEMVKSKQFYLYILLSLIFFGIFCKMEYATDTYNVLQTSLKEMTMHFISSGRFITAIIYIIFKILNISGNIAYIVSFISAIIFTSIATYKLERILIKDIKSKIIATIASILVIINIFSIELYLFIEKGILVLSVLLCVCAVEKLVQYFEGNKKSLIGAFIYMILANFSYQGTVGIFVSIALIYIIKYSKNIKELLKNTIITALCYGIPAIMNYIIVRFAFINDRVSGTTNLLESIDKIINNLDYMMISTYEIIPKYLFVVVILLVSLITIYCITKERINLKKKLWLISGMFLIIIGNFVVTIFPQLMQNTEAIWFVPRSTYAFASLLGILIIYLFMNTKVNYKSEKVLTIILIAYMLVQYVSFQNIARDRYILNYMDSYISATIQEKVNDYEEKTGNIIKKVAFYENKKEEQQYSYPELFTSRDTNVRAFYPKWSRLKAINYYLNKDLEEVDANSEIEEKYFSKKKWKYYDNDQIVLINDTMHMYIF